MPAANVRRRGTGSPEHRHDASSPSGTQPRRLFPGLLAFVTTFFFTTREAFFLPAFVVGAVVALLTLALPDFFAAGVRPPKIESQPSAYVPELPTRITDMTASIS